jgi:hypothetical protein
MLVTNGAERGSAASGRGAAPSRIAIAHAIGEADELLLALGRGTDDDQRTLRLVLGPGLDVDAVDPEVDVALDGEIALAPARMLLPRPPSAG